MRPSQYKDLEKSNKFKRFYLSKTAWWRSFLLVPPILLLFIGLAGIMYIGQNYDLWSWYSAPYILIFVIGTIWIKAVKNNIQNKILNDKDKFIVCAAKAVGKKDGRFYFILSKDTKRHDETLIKNLAEKLTPDSFSETELMNAKKELTKTLLTENGVPIYMIGIDINKVVKAKREKITETVTPLIYISPKDTFIVRNKDLL